MAKFWNSMASSITSAFNKNIDPNQVREVTAAQYAVQPVRRREDCLLLYCPAPAAEGKAGPAGEGAMVFSSQGGDNRRASVTMETGPPFEVVVQSERNVNSCYSLFRTRDISEAEARFEAYLQILPAFLSIKPELATTSNLQKIIDKVRECPSCSLCHLAVLLDMPDMLPSPVFSSSINAVDSDGITALMTAVDLGSKHLTLAVLAAGASIDGSDRVGNTVFHHATKASLAIMEILTDNACEVFKHNLDGLSKLLDQPNAEGQAALHLACTADKPDLVKALLCAGADLNTLASQDGCARPIWSANPGAVKSLLGQFPAHLNIKELRAGGTPAHWATEKPLLEGLLDLGCALEAHNCRGDTALHVMTKAKRLGCVVCLLSNGAEVDCLDASGNTPLHLAVATGHLPTLQALLVFGADWRKKNGEGETPWTIALKSFQSKFGFANVERDRNLILHCLHSVGAEGPSDLTPNARDFDWKPPITEKNQLGKRCRHLFDDFLGKAAAHVEGSKSGVRVLCLDGGGIKGLVLIKLLDCLSKAAGDRPVASLCDWMVGTSTGGILCLALAVGKSPMQCQGLYFKLKDRVFVGKRPYDVTPMEDLLKLEFGEELLMKDLPACPKVAVTGTLADRYPADLHFFRNYTSPMDLLGIRENLLPEMSPVKRPDQQSVWQAARSSGAAPTYFQQAGRFIDGGLIANNPTLDVLTEIHERNQALRGVGRAVEVEEVGVVLSLGTGDPPTEKVDSVDLKLPDGILGIVSAVSGASAMGRLLVDQAASATNRVVDRARAWCSMAGITYVRLCPQLASDIRLDETSDEVLVEMLWRSQAYMHEQRDQVNLLVKLLDKAG